MSTLNTQYVIYTSKPIYIPFIFDWFQNKTLFYFYPYLCIEMTIIGHVNLKVLAATQINSFV